VELNSEFRVAVPAAKTWEVLTDVERVAPCLPGATLLSVGGDEFTGAVKVKVGPSPCPTREKQRSWRRTRRRSG
jgi:carbon monoxide dehydrogenase subunit G